MWTRHSHPLGKLPLLAGAPRSAVTRLGSLMTLVTFPAGHVLVEQGARNAQFVLVEQGTLSVTRDGVTVAQLGAGEFVGELSLLGDGRANATVTTLTDVQAYVSSSVEFDALLRSTLGETIQAEAARRSA